jgi:ParB family chromosome partitioning protein
VKKTREGNVASQDDAGALGAELRSIRLGLIDEPDLPARETMDQDSLENLQASMAEVGLLSPIVVVVSGERFRVVAGHRRLLAARFLKWEAIRAFIYPAGWRDELAAQLHENIIREDLNPAQEAIFFAQLLERHKLDEAGLCAAVKRTPDYVAARLALLRGDERIFESLRAGHISFAVARVLNRFPDQAMRRYYFDAALRSGTSARVVEEWLRDWQANQVPGAPAAPAPSAPLAPVSVEVTPIRCFFCGGGLDPYNLVTVMIHKWELAEIQRRLAAAAVESSGEDGQ